MELYEKQLGQWERQEDRVFGWKKPKLKVVILGMMVLFVLYLVIGMLAPFMRLKNVEEQETFSEEAFYGTDSSVDRAAIIETSEAALDERIRLIEQAQERIILSTFDMREGSSSSYIGAALIHAADRGVQVQILVDGVSGLLRMEGSEFFYALSSYPNIEVRIYNKPNIAKPWTINGRMHDKYLIADHLGYLMGGRNTFDYFLGDSTNKHKSYDREILIYNTAHDTKDEEKSSVYEIEKYFESVWNAQECKVFHKEEKLQEKEKVQEQIHRLRKKYKTMQTEYPNWFDRNYKYEDHTVETNKVTLISGETHIYGKEPRVFHVLSQLMQQAEQRVVLHTPYAVLSDEMYEALENIAKKVPEFRMVVNAVETGDNFVASSDYLRNKGKILETGVTLQEYVGDFSSHGKSILIDDRISIIGSYNLDLRSTYMDTELMLVVDSKPLNQELEACFKVFEDRTRTAINETEYTQDSYEQEIEVSVWKKLGWSIVGLLLQPFRVVI